MEGVVLAGYNVRRILLICVALIAVVFVAAQVHHYLSTGKLSVSTGNYKGYIRLSGPDGRTIGGQKQSHKLTKRLKPGMYSVAAYIGRTYTSKLVTIKARQTLHLSLPLTDPSNPEPVLGKSANGMSVGKDTMYFIDPSSKHLMKVDAQGKTNVVDGKQNFIKVGWMSVGVGIAMDDAHELLALNNGSVRKLSLPFPVNGNPSINFDVSPAGNLYVSNGQDVYAGTPGGDFKKIYSSGNDYNSGLAAGNAEAAFVEKSPDKGPRSLVVLSGGRTLKVPSEASQLAWSPDGKYIAALGGKSLGIIYDNNLKVAYRLADKGTTSPIWHDNKTLLYATGNVVMSFGLSNQLAQSIAALPANQSIEGGAINSDQNYLYFSTNKSVLRIGLNGQPASNLVALSSFLPETVGVCSFDYVNFIKPTIVISYPSLEGDSVTCENSARSQLRYFGLNPGDFQYTIAPVIQNIPTDDNLNP